VRLLSVSTGQCLQQIALAGPGPGPVVALLEGPMAHTVPMADSALTSNGKILGRQLECGVW
jgi:hypothetical protein